MHKGRPSFSTICLSEEISLHWRDRSGAWVATHSRLSTPRLIGGRSTGGCYPRSSYPFHPFPTCRSGTVYGGQQRFLPAAAAAIPVPDALPLRCHNHRRPESSRTKLAGWQSCQHLSSRASNPKVSQVQPADSTAIPPRLCPLFPDPSGRQVRPFVQSLAMCWSSFLQKIRIPPFAFEVRKQTDEIVERAAEWVKKERKKSVVVIITGCWKKSFVRGGGGSVASAPLVVVPFASFPPIKDLPAERWPRLVSLHLYVLILRDHGLSTLLRGPDHVLPMCQVNIQRQSSLMMMVMTMTTGAVRLGRPSRTQNLSITKRLQQPRERKIDPENTKNADKQTRSAAKTWNSRPMARKAETKNSRNAGRTMVQFV